MERQPVSHRTSAHRTLGRERSILPREAAWMRGATRAPAVPVRAPEAVASEVDAEREARFDAAREAELDAQIDAQIDAQVADSFPASDVPSWTLGPPEWARRRV